MPYSIEVLATAIQKRVGAMLKAKRQLNAHFNAVMTRSQWMATTTTWKTDNLCKKKKTMNNNNNFVALATGKSWQQQNTKTLILI